MIVHDVQQRSLDWQLLRAGLPTASDFDQLLTPLFKKRDGDMPQSYLALKLAEWWQGGPEPSATGFDMEQGEILEREAIPRYELEQEGLSVRRVGFITNDEKTCGCSPDGLIVSSGHQSTMGIEIKCPAARTHMRYLLAGGLPKEYLAQIHGSMFVTGLPRWQFYSYRRNFPSLLITVERDPEIQEQIAFAIADFTARLEGGKALLTEINGGPPKPMMQYVPRDLETQPPAQQSEPATDWMP